MGIEKRRHIRIDSENLSHVIVEGEGQPVNEGIGKTLNLSESGILLETHFPVDSGQEVDLYLALGEQLVSVRGAVIHSRPNENGVSRTGIQFRNVDDEAAAMLKQFVVLFKQQQSLNEL